MPLKRMKSRQPSGLKLRLLAAAVAVAAIAAPLFPKQVSSLTPYPARPVSLVVPVQAGSQTDVLARLISGPLQAHFGKPFIVENRAGGGGTIAGAGVAKAAADGHTLLYGSMSSIILAPQLRSPPPYDSTKDFVPVVLTATGPTVLVVPESSPIKTIAELVKYAKANPGKLNLGSHGVGAFSHICMELFMELTGAQMQHIPYTGGGPLLTGFLSGDVQVVLFDSVTILPHVQSGKARPLAIVSRERSSVYPGVPTVAETVAPGLVSDFWLGILAPASTPRDIVVTLNQEINAIMRRPENKARVEAASMTVPNDTPEVFGGKISEEWETWGRVIRDKGITQR